MKFATENFFLIAIAVVSGALLFWPIITRRMAGAMVDNLAATRMVNDQGAVLLDVRSGDDFAAGHLPQARHIPADDVAKRAGELPSNKPIILYCGTSRQSGKAAGALRAAGRDQVFVLDGGLNGWRQSGLPVVK